MTSLPETTKGWRGKNACIDAAHRVHARAEDAIRTGKDTGIGRFPSFDFKVNQAWIIAAILLAWLKLLALDGDLAAAEPKTLRYRVLHTPGPAGARRAPQALEDRRELAVGRGDRAGLAAYLRAARRQLTSTDPSLATRGSPRACATPAPGPSAGPLSYPDAKISAVTAILGALRGSQQPL